MWSELKEHLSHDFGEIEKDVLGAEILADKRIAEALADLMERAIEPRITLLISCAKTLYESKLKEIEAKTRT